MVVYFHHPADAEFHGQSVVFEPLLPLRYGDVHGLPTTKQIDNRKRTLHMKDAGIKKVKIKKAGSAHEGAQAAAQGGGLVAPPPAEL